MITNLPSVHDIINKQLEEGTMLVDMKDHFGFNPGWVGKTQIATYYDGKLYMVT